ncbi:MAG TPA: glycoside hydrolase family 2 protein [Ferruginibacter sp.]|nr:glycoside hydrolase family 2 protein [Ferruginibacter sp.]
MKTRLITSIILITIQTISAQNISIELNQNWQFKNQKENKWYKATVPGTVHTDLLANKLIPNPFFRNNESKLQWIDKADWEYRTIFNVDTATFSKKGIYLIFDGLDTYADVYLNGKLILQADNMFRGWRVNVKSLLRRSDNELLIRFASAQNKVDSIAKAMLPLVLPDNNRVYVRKAQYHFGWDWGPKFVGCGIWKKINLKASDRSTAGNYDPVKIKTLVQQKDSIGTSFYFEKDGKPIYAKGANWIPADVFLPRLKREDYRRMLQSVKDANMNMLRVWGGGVYEADEFYDLCDSLGIMVWQDFMFAGGMIPGDDAFFSNVREEVKYQIERLRHHHCIVLWCGNNEIDEAWNNWGWQNQFNLHGADSAKVWNDYKRMFRDSLPKWVNEFDGERPYVSTSPRHGWGRRQSMTEGDSHYWGLWWGLEDWETFENKTGRFVSEYGMQAMPNWNTVKSFTEPADRYLYSPVINAHQKANDGFKKINHYLNRYFIDSSKLKRLSLEDYTYLTQCMQYYILKNTIAVHRSKYPVNMGTLLWQMNDCWPVASWSITDYSREPKAAWYAVKEAYRDDVKPVKDTVYPKDLKLQKPEFTFKPMGESSFTITSNVDARYVYLSHENGLKVSENYFDLKAGESKRLSLLNRYFSPLMVPQIKIRSLYDVINK